MFYGAYNNFLLYKLHFYFISPPLNTTLTENFLHYIFKKNP